jgi:hypothetical protein
MMVYSHHTTVRHTLTGSFYVVLSLLGRRDYWDFMGYDGMYLELPVSIFFGQILFPFHVILPEVFVQQNVIFCPSCVLFAMQTGSCCSL